MSIFFLISLIELHRLRQPMNDDRKDQPHERREPVAIAIRHHQIKRDGPFVVDQVLNRKVARRRVPDDQRIAVDL